MQNVNMKLHPGFRNIKQEESSFHQQTELKFKEETDIMLYLQPILYCAEMWTLQKVDQKYLESINMVLDKDAEIQLGRSCEK
jgi:hypothetical protein